MFYDFIFFGQEVPNETKGTINLKYNPRRKSMQESESHNVLVRHENTVTRDNCSVSLDKPRNAERLRS